MLNPRPSNGGREHPGPRRLPADNQPGTGGVPRKNDSMIQYLAVAQRLIKKFMSCKLTQIPPEQNSQADAMANLGSTR